MTRMERLRDLLRRAAEAAAENNQPPKGDSNIDTELPETKKAEDKVTELSAVDLSTMAGHKAGGMSWWDAFREALQPASSSGPAAVGRTAIPRKAPASPAVPPPVAPKVTWTQNPKKRLRRQPGGGTQPVSASRPAWPVDKRQPEA